MDVILILAVSLLIVFIGALFYAKRRQPGLEKEKFFWNSWNRFCFFLFKTNSQLHQLFDDRDQSMTIVRDELKLDDDLYLNGITMVADKMLLKIPMKCSTMMSMIHLKSIQN